MKKLPAILAIVIASLVAATTPAGATASTGTFGPAEEPTWVIPLVVIFVVGAMVVAFLGVRRRGDTSRRGSRF